jgi:hypothetical protein
MEWENESNYPSHLHIQISVTSKPVTVYSTKIMCIIIDRLSFYRILVSLTLKPNPYGINFHSQIFFQSYATFISQVIAPMIVLMILILIMMIIAKLLSYIFVLMNILQICSSFLKSYNPEG